MAWFAAFRHEVYLFATLAKVNISGQCWWFFAVKFCFHSLSDDENSPQHWVVKRKLNARRFPVNIYQYYFVSIALLKLWKKRSNSYFLEFSRHWAFKLQLIHTLLNSPQFLQFFFYHFRVLTIRSGKNNSITDFLLHICCCNNWALKNELAEPFFAVAATKLRQ